MSRTAGLPLFRGLIEGVYQQLGEDWNLHTAEREGMEPNGQLAGQYDRVLRSLERRLLTASGGPQNRGMRERIRTAVRHVLAPPDNVDLANHLALLELSRDAEGRTRLLTTNFDTLFERAWFNKYQTSIASHAGVAMPQPKVAGCTGVLHLHGRLADPRPELHATETDLVLTSAEFGDAYLRLGWASRYIYNSVRAYTVVLVGYQADDPPMRYLLEALEADRERYPDLQKVYAFASCEPGEGDLVRSLWEAKGVEPILYVARNHDHGLLYNSLREWQRYAEDPTAWRLEQLRGLLSEDPVTLPEARMRECVELLGHGDASQLLAELSPSAAWLPVLAGHRVFERGNGMPGAWIAAQINDPDMIQACAGLRTLDQQARWQIDVALRREYKALSQVRIKAWQIILAAKRPRNEADVDDSWYLPAPNIKRGEGGFDARRLAARILRPRLQVGKAVRWQEEPADSPEALHHLLRFEFNPSEHPSSNDILANWPETLEYEIALFRALDRALIDALEEAEDVGYLDGWDRASAKVPSVADHPQNEYRFGFCPITRALAELWLRIAGRDANLARALAVPWAKSPFLLIRRLFLFAVENVAFSPREAAASVQKLDDATFWASDAQVEIMRLLVDRWAALEVADRELIEARLRCGIPRTQYPENSFKEEDEWISIRDSSIYRRLKRIKSAGGALVDASEKLLVEIAARHSEWQPAAGDRDDFRAWHEFGGDLMAIPNCWQILRMID